MTTKGLLCSILKAAHSSCSNGGISSKCRHVILTGTRCEIFESTSTAPAVKLVTRNLNGKRHTHAEPVDQPTRRIGPMFGGTFIYTSDSGFPSDHPIPLHDRFE